MSLNAWPPPITTYSKTTNIYVLVNFCTNSWRRPWGGRCMFNTFWSSDGPLFHHLRHGGLRRYDSLQLTGVSHTPTCWDVGSTRLQAVLGLPLRKPRLHRRLARRTTPPRGGSHFGTCWRGALHRLRDARLQRRGIYTSF